MSAVTATPMSHQGAPATASTSKTASGATTATATATHTRTSSVPSVDSLTSDLAHSTLDSIDAAASDTRTLKQKLLGIDVDEAGDRLGVSGYLRSRVYTDGGESLIVIGGSGDDDALTPDEYSSIKQNIIDASKDIACEASILYEKPDTPQAWIMLRQIPTAPQDFVEIRVACVGNVDAGKSTTLGVLTRGGLDDGRGKARVNLFRHKHEIETGRTSSVGMELLGLTAKGEHVTTAAGSKEEGRKLSWEELCARSAKIVNFIDLAGHERYLRTTIGGLTANIPEYGMLMVGANAGLIGMSKEHLGVALALSIPVFITITKIDMCPPQILEATIKQLTKVLKSPGCRKTPVFVESMEQVVDCAARLGTERICPIVSRTSGQQVVTDVLTSISHNAHTVPNIKRHRPSRRPLALFPQHSPSERLDQVRPLPAL